MYRKKVDSDENKFERVLKIVLGPLITYNVLVRKKREKENAALFEFAEEIHFSMIPRGYLEMEAHGW